MKITFQTKEEWYKGIAAMVREGVTFEASDWGGNYTIEFTGGY